MLYPEIFIVDIDRQRIGRICLELYGICSGSFRLFDQGDRPLKILPMICGYFGDNETAVDLFKVHHLISVFAYTGLPAVF